MPTPSPAEAIHQEVLTNILNQPLESSVDYSPPSYDQVLAQPALRQLHSPATVADLALPAELLTRITDRIMRSSFQDHFRLVVSDNATLLPVRNETILPAETAPAAASHSGSDAALAPNIKVVQSTLLPDDPILAWPEARPACRGFRPLLFLEDFPSSDPQSQGTTEQEWTAAAWINHRLAFDGLLRTLAQVIAILGTKQFLHPAGEQLLQLTRVGFPVDLLDYFDQWTGRPARTNAMPILPGETPGPLMMTLVPPGETPGPLMMPVPPGETPGPLIQQIALLVTTAGPLNADLSGFQFRFRRTSQNFLAASDAGMHDAALVRLQLTRGSHWLGPGSGDNLDLVNALLRHLPAVPVLASIQSCHLETLRSNISAWMPGSTRTITIIAEPLPVSQWARDNARPGLIVARLTSPERERAGPENPANNPLPYGRGSSKLDNAFALDGLAARRCKHAALIPRFASRGDDGSVFVPGENALLRMLPACGIELIHSPLMFQGGNILLVPDPLAQFNESHAQSQTNEPHAQAWGRNNTHLIPADPDSPAPPAPLTSATFIPDRPRHILLIGEAEIARNVALGLTPAEALDALTIEFGADRAAVLPSVSYHIDYEVCFRVLPSDSPQGSKVVAFVNDSSAAVRLIIECGLNMLESKHILPRARAKSARQMLRSGKWGDLVDLLQASVLYPSTVKRGDVFGFRESFARHFSDRPGDNGVGNFYAFLMAFDLMASWQVLPTESKMMAFGQAVMQGIRRRDADRVALHHQLRTLGFVVVPVPSTADAERGINYLNGVHVPDRYLMPTWGGMYTPLDDAAAAVFHRALGPNVSVQEISSAESQRRSGAVHCSTSIHFA